jgi:hypothetical protein
VHPGLTPNKGENIIYRNDSKPCGWINPPDGWEWIGAKQEYKQKMTGIRICYRPTYNEWGVFFPPNFITMNDFIAESLSHAFENYAS